MRRLGLALGLSSIFALGAGCFDFTGVQCDVVDCPNGYFCDSSSRCLPEGEPDRDGGPLPGGDGGVDGGQTDGGQTDGGQTDGGQTDGGQTDGGNTDAGTQDAGTTDGGCTSGAPRSCGNGLGACAGATEICGSNGQWGPCSFVATPEVCNGLDDDCDGTTDEPHGPVQLATGVNEFQVAAMDGGFVAVMTTIAGGTSGRIQFQAYDSQLNPLIPMTQVDDRPGRALGGAISTLGTTTLLSWVHDHQDGGASVYLAGIGLNGVPSFLTQVSGGAVDRTETANSPNLAGNRIAVLWQAGARLFGRTYDPSGTADGGVIPLTLTIPGDQVVIEHAAGGSPSGGFRYAYSWSGDLEAGLELFDTVSNLDSPALTGSFYSPLGVSDPQLDLFGSTAGLSWDESGLGYLTLDGGAPTTFGPVASGLDMVYLHQRPVAVFEQPVGTVVVQDFTQRTAPDGGQVLAQAARLPSVAAGAVPGTLAVAYRSDAGTIEGVLHCIPVSY
ncbi:MAG: putative metal-binding motif-containing protein [Myxococcota bacterium]|nr:putative metal-binding motif-containing protein [Myxococcota bacterium]